MAQHFTQDFIDLSYRGFGSNPSPELAFNHGEGGFHIRPLMIVAEESRPIEAVIMPHLIPQSVKCPATLTAFGVGLERNVGDAANGVDSSEALAGRIGFISRHFANLESLRCLIYQMWKLRGIRRFGGGDFYAGNNIGGNAAHQVSLNPFSLTPHLAPLVVKPSVISGGSEAGRINRKVGFNGLKRAGAFLNECFQYVGQFRVFKIAEGAVIMGGFGDKASRFSLFKLTGESPTGHCGISLVSQPENYISQRQTGTPKSLRRLLNAIAQVTQKAYKVFLLMGLSRVVFRPFLAVSNPHGLSGDNSPIRPFLALNNELNGIDMFARQFAFFKVGAGAEGLPFLKTNNISAFARLGRHFPTYWRFDNLATLSNLQSSFLSRFHFNSPYLNSDIKIPYLVWHINTFLAYLREYFSKKLLTKAILSMVYYKEMENGSFLLSELKSKGWGNQAIADRIGVTKTAVEKWRSGERNISQSHLILLGQLLKQKAPRKWRRNSKGQGVAK